MALVPPACTMQWALPPATPVSTLSAAVTSVPTVKPLPATPTLPVPTQTSPPERSHWTVGLLDEPATFVPFSADGRAATPISEVLFPSPVLGLGYAYTTTGILTELPSLANGGVHRRNVSGYLDVTGQFTSTVTGQPTSTTQLSVTFHWNPNLRWA